MLLPSSSGGGRGAAAAAFKTYLQTCATLLDKCLAGGSLAGGQAIHAHAIKTGISSLRPLPAKFLTIYSAAGGAGDCAAALRESCLSSGGFDLLSWNVTIAAWVRNGELAAARRLFDAMPERNDISWTLMIDGSMKSGKVSDGIAFLRGCPSPTVVSWTAAMAGLVQNGHPLHALELFHGMLMAGVAPNEITFTAAVRASIAAGRFDLGGTSFLSISNSLITLHTRMKDLASARQIFDRMKTKDVVSWTAMLDLYFQEGDLRGARKTFDEMPHKNEVSWSLMVARHNQAGQAMEALKLFERMFCAGLRPTLSSLSAAISAAGGNEALLVGSTLHGCSIKLGIDDSDFISSSLIDMYCKCGRPEEGRRVFDVAPEKKNLICWNAMVSGYCRNGSFPDAMELFERMPQRNRASWNGLISGLILDASGGGGPSALTLSSVLRCCAGSSALEKGRAVHCLVAKLGLQDDLFMGTALTDMVFSLMGEKNEASWSAAIHGFAANGLAEEALLLFEDAVAAMKVPTGTLFLSVLSACAHGGLVEKGLRYFGLMRAHGLVPAEKHYACLVDLLARAGRLPGAWAALLSACRGRVEEEVAERAAVRLREMEEGDPRSYVLLSSVYAGIGRWEDAERVRALMGPAGVRKGRGCSWVVGKGRGSHRFVCGDVSHERGPEIYEMLELLMSEMSSCLVA
ncbi:unnamed protein product [Spirodela intermedia]|uniref:Uncharacterized protein n=1 Tax=Spirodela intermedia TaxID=51605 RepID=A0A7I8JSC8_SPIIN|nr:unnamed protein product [Spirodela intermedia]CAA6673088.1 unnamed protein product [Spirodela intermedia]